MGFWGFGVLGFWSFEDDRIDRPSNEDYNDIVLAIDGIQEPIGLSNIEDNIFPERNWLERPLGSADILPYFNITER